MDPQTPAAKSPPNVYQIGGVAVEFPHKPYGSQLAFMGRVIATLDRAHRQGHCHALLESPTGTGKTLSLLCSAIAWQSHHQRRMQSAANTSFGNEGVPYDPLVNGGGFVPEGEPSIPDNVGQIPLPQGTSLMVQKKVPTIYYASRTHSQISQVIREYKKTSYRVPMAILAARKRYCTNDNVCLKDNIDEECKLLLKDEVPKCLEFKNANKIRNHPSIQRGGCYEVHDIEDLVNVARTVKGCAYFASQALAEVAQIVFCPYNYIISPIVRKAMDLDIKGSILILDEAHNIEDFARSAGSLEVEDESLYKLQSELGQLSEGGGAAIYQPLHDMIQGLVGWISERKLTLQKHDFEHYCSHWTGENALRELQQAGITQQCLPILLECATKAIKAASEAESTGNYLSGLSAIVLEELFSSLCYLFSENGGRANDYQLALQKYIKKDNRNIVNDWICKLSLWCLNPGVIFKEIADLCLSVILTSGTLSPMGSFASELGVQFEACMDAPHVIDVESQLWAAVIPSGPSNCRLNASYKTADAYAFQDDLGASLEEICKSVHGGALVFFPSYKLLEKLQNRWRQTGQWSRLNAKKPIFTEPRGTSEEFDIVLQKYYDAIRGTKKSKRPKIKLASKKDSKHLTDKNNSNAVKEGAAFLAVCRGKVSEGIDFSDDNARVVVIVGIPFPNINDIQVGLKKKYNDTHRLSKGLLTGNEWYCHQAFRALNQAAGRCIRHRFDYGAIIFLDERFKEERNVTYISKWIKNSIKQFSSFEESLLGLKNFFESAEKQFRPKSNHATIKDDVLENKLFNLDQNKNLPCSKLDAFDQIIEQKTSQKIKKEINQNAKRNNNKPSKPLTPSLEKRSSLCSKMNNCCEEGGLPEGTDFKPWDRCKESNDNKNHEGYTETTSAIKSGNSDHPIMPEVIIIDDDATLKGRLANIQQFHNKEPSKPLTPSVEKRNSLCSKMNNCCEEGGLPEGTDFKPLDRCTESNDNKNHERYRETTSTIASDNSDHPITPEVIIIDDDATLKGRLANIDDGCTIANASSPLLESPLSPAAVPYGTVSEGTCISSVTPERRKLINPHSAQKESSLNTSVNSNFQKRKKLSHSQLSDCRKIDDFSSPDRTGSFFQVGFGSSKSAENSKHLIPSPAMSLRNESLEKDAISQKRIEISCTLCKNSLGLREDNFLVTCSFISSSKVYLVNLLREWASSVTSLECCMGTRSRNIPVIMCDTSAVDNQILLGNIKGATPQHGVWSEEDGCVFKDVICLHCTAHKTCLGAQIIATDASNSHLLNKVLFFADKVDVKDEQAPIKEVTIPKYTEAPPEVSGLFQKYAYQEIRKYAYNSARQEISITGTRRSKLSLPKRRQLS